MAQTLSTEKSGRTRVPPYVAFRTLKTFVEDLKTHGIPNRIDRSVWGSRFSGSVGAQLMSALRFLRLIGENDQPEKLLEELVNTHGTANWSNTLTEMIAEAYEPIVSLNLQVITPQELSEAFREHYPAQENVLRKSIAFFLQAAREGGFEISGRILKGTRRVDRPRVKTATKKPVPENDPGRGPARRVPTDGGDSAYQMLFDILDPEGMDDQEQQAVWTLIRYLKRSGKAG